MRPIHFLLTPMTETKTPIQAEGVIVLANADSGELLVEMHMPQLPQGEEPDLDNGAQQMLVWFASNWDAFMTAFNVAYTKLKDKSSRDAENGVEDAKIIEPSGLKLVAPDGNSLLQH
jgi:hypothetical protein